MEDNFSFGSSHPSKLPDGLTAEFMQAFEAAESNEDLEKLMADEKQFMTLLDGLVQEQCVKAAANLFEGVALHYAAVRDGDYQDAQRLASEIASRANELSIAHGLQVAQINKKESE
jgi:hypothetical protein